MEPKIAVVTPASTRAGVPKLGLPGSFVKRLYTNYLPCNRFNSSITLRFPLQFLSINSIVSSSPTRNVSVESNRYPISYVTTITRFQGGRIYNGLFIMRHIREDDFLLYCFSTSGHGVQSAAPSFRHSPFPLVVSSLSF